MVDDAEFLKRRHLSRGRPRKYEPNNPKQDPIERTIIESDTPEEDNSESPPPNTNHTTSVTSVSNTPSTGVSNSRPDVCQPMLTASQMGSNSNIGSMHQSGLSNQAALMAAAAQFKSNLTGTGPQ